MSHTPGPWGIENDTITSASGDIARLHYQSARDDDNARLIASAPEMLQALEYCAELVKTARRRLPKSIRNSDRFQLESACAAINTAIHHARG